MKKTVLLALATSLILGLTAQAQVKARWIVTNEDALQARVDMIRKARKEMLVEYFIMSEDPRSIAGLALALDAARRGVKVKVILDAMFASLSPSMYAALYEKAKGPNGENNLEIKVYNPLNWNLIRYHQRTHAKMIIIDGKTLLTGGRNVEDSYFGYSEKLSFDDLDILVEGSLAQDARNNFYAVWNSDLVREPYLINYTLENLSPASCATREDYEACIARQQFAVSEVKRQQEIVRKSFEQLADETEEDNKILFNTQQDWLKNAPTINKVQFISHKPDELVSEKTAYLSHDLLKILRSAKRDANIVSPYLIPTPNVIEAFQHLIDKGVRVRVITNSLHSTDNFLAQAGYRSAQKQLTEMGIEIWEYKGPHTIHAKTALIDGNQILIGTYNIDPRSSFLNREMGVALLDDQNTGLAKQLEDTIEGFRKQSVLVAKDGQVQNIEWQRESIQKLKGSAKAQLTVLKFLMPAIKWLL